MELLSKKDFEGMDFGPNMSSLEMLRIVAGKAKQRMMGTFNFKKEETEAYKTVSTSLEIVLVEKNASNKRQVVISKKKKPTVKKPENTQRNYKKKSNCAVEKESGGWRTRKENGIREQKDISFERNGLKRKFQDEHKRVGKKLVPNSTGDLPEEFKKEIETSGEVKEKVMIDKKSFQSGGVYKDADDHDWDSDCALRKKKHKGSNKKRKNEKFVPKTSATTSHDLPEEFKKKIETLGGNKVKLVIEKTLFKSDLLSGENRLSMPFKQICPEFLEDDEVKRLEKKETWALPLIDTRLQEREIGFKQWNLQTSKWYVLKTQWHKEIVVKNGLKKGDLIQVWSFRDQANRLHLALVLVERKGEITNAAGRGKNGLFLLGESSSGNTGGSSV